MLLQREFYHIVVPSLALTRDYSKTAFQSYFREIIRKLSASDQWQMCEIGQEQPISIYTYQDSRLFSYFFSFSTLDFFLAILGRNRVQVSSCSAQTDHNPVTGSAKQATGANCLLSKYIYGEHNLSSTRTCHLGFKSLNLLWFQMTKER